MAAFDLFHKRPADTPPQYEAEHAGDACTKEGAQRLKETIESYWRERGYTVDVKLYPAGFLAAMRSARTDIRSDMANGYPRALTPPLPSPENDNDVR